MPTPRLLLTPMFVCIHFNMYQNTHAYVHTNGSMVRPHRGATGSVPPRKERGQKLFDVGGVVVGCACEPRIDDAGVIKMTYVVFPTADGWISSGMTLKPWRRVCVSIRSSHHHDAFLLFKHFLIVPSRCREVHTGTTLGALSGGFCFTVFSRRGSYLVRAIGRGPKKRECFALAGVAWPP